MSPPLLSIGEEEGQSNVTLLACSSSMESICKNGAGLKERNYMGLSDSSSVGSSTISSASEDSNVSLNLKATELRLGLPGSQSPERSPELCLLSSAKHDEKPLFPLHPVKDGNNILSQKTVILGSKRGFTDAMNGFSEGKFVAKSEVNTTLSPMSSSNTGVKSVCSKDPLTLPAKLKDVKAEIKVQERPRHTTAANNSSNAPAPKAQVVGWPPIRSFRKNSLANTSKNTGEVDGKAGPGALFVKVSMDGAPYLRKVDLRTYSVYQDLSSALEKMFSCFIIGQYGSHGASGREMLSERKLKDLLHGSEYVLTYEDKDGDWMLVGDVPWEFFRCCAATKVLSRCILGDTRLTDLVHRRGGEFVLRKVCETHDSTVHSFLLDVYWHVQKAENYEEF